MEDSIAKSSIDLAFCPKLPCFRLLLRLSDKYENLFMENFNKRLPEGVTVHSSRLVCSTGVVLGFVIFANHHVENHPKNKDVNEALMIIEDILVEILGLDYDYNISIDETHLVQVV